MEHFDSLSVAMGSNHLPLAMIPFCPAATNFILKYWTIRTHGDLITAKAKSAASSNGAAELVPGGKSSLPVNYAIILLFQTDRGGRSSS